MEKKEYQSPKMEVIEMPVGENLLQSSGSRKFLMVEICDGCSDGEDD